MRGDIRKDPKRLVQQGYDRVAHKYACLEGKPGWPRMRWLEKLLTRLEPGSSILDMGCGSGDPVDVEIAKSHRITGIDFSWTQIHLARQNVPDGSFIQADAGSISFPPASFDAVITFYTLEHIPREEHETILRCIHQWLRPGGYLLIGTEPGDVTGMVVEWLNVPMYFSAFDAEKIEQLVNQVGFDLLESKIEKQQEQEKEIPYLSLLARKQEG